MNNRQSRLISAGESAIAFVLQLKHPPSRVTEAAKRLKDALRAARAVELKQLSAKNSRRAPRHSVSRAKTILLRKYLDPIAADGLEMFAGLPGIEESLQVPRIKDAPEQHLEAAKRVRRVAEEHEEEFITERNYDENFLERFDRAVRDLEAAARVERGFARAKYTRATVDVKDEIARVRRVFDVLDTRILEAYLDDRSTQTVAEREPSAGRGWSRKGTRAAPTPSRMALPTSRSSNWLRLGSRVAGSSGVATATGPMRSARSRASLLTPLRPVSPTAASHRSAAPSGRWWPALTKWISRPRPPITTSTMTMIVANVDRSRRDAIRSAGPPTAAPLRA